MDADYLHLLTPQQKATYLKFISEYYGANLDFKNLRKNIHKSKTLKKDCTDRNNRQNNDLFGVANTNALLTRDYNENHTAHNTQNLQEDALIAFIDNKETLIKEANESVDKKELRPKRRQQPRKSSKRKKRRSSRS